MKNHLISYMFKGLALMLFCAMSSSLFAISFNEQRRVIIPQDSNAVYRGLSVLDTMYWNIAKPDNRFFMLELGKRPTYFWTEFTENNKMFYMFQNVELNLGKMSCSLYANGSFSPCDENQKNLFTIQDIMLDNGSFYSEGLFMTPHDLNPVHYSATVNNSLSNLLINYTGPFNIDLYLGEDADDYLVFAHTLKFGPGRFDLNSVRKGRNVYLRDVLFNPDGKFIPFPSPRMMIYKDTSDVPGKYHANGTAINFELANPKRETRTKNYFGAWELWKSNTQGHVLRKSDSNSPCTGDTPNRCYKWSAGSQIFDTNDKKFTCVGNKTSSGNGLYDPTTYYEPDINYCYDYQEVELPYDASNTEAYNNNESYYEFKIEEIYDVNNSTAVLLTQTPKTITKIYSSGDHKAFPLVNYNGATWSLTTDDDTKYIFINGSRVMFSGTLKELNSTSEQNPCFYICDGKLCTQNHVYVRNWNIKELKNDNISNLWPESEGHKQHLALLTYTIGYCPKRDDIDYSNYELKNNNDSSKLIDALLIKDTGGNWVTPKVCMRREVRCNQLNEPGYKRSFTLLSTDY